MSINDNLTDITNRYQFALSFYNAINSNIEEHIDFSILIIKLDSLQEISKQFGLQSAYCARSTLVNILLANIKAQDQVYSSGLDTYSVILNEVGDEPVSNIRDRLMQVITKDPLFLELNVACNIGCADYQSRDKLTFLFARAERDLCRSEKKISNRFNLLARAV